MALEMNAGHTVKEAQAWLRLAERAALAAGKYLQKIRRSEVRVAARLRHDIKLEADRGSEAIILRILGEGSRLPILTEERGRIRGRGARVDDGLCWIVDPLDGSLNFKEGIPIACVSVGLWRGSAPILGVVYDIGRRELYSGIASKGAWLNGRPIRVKKARPVDRAVLCTGFPAGFDVESPAVKSFISRLRRFCKLRLLGSAAFSLCLVAAGAADAYCEENICIWDVAAGLAIVKGAKGTVGVKGFSKSLRLKAWAASSGAIKRALGVDNG